jgi:ABC-type multidrug transport system fused ATPase/permease subunit
VGNFVDEGGPGLHQGRGGIRPLHGREPDQPRRHAELYNRQPFYSGLVNTLIAAGTALVIYVGARSVLSDTLSVGQLIVFISYVAQLYVPVNQLTQSWGLLSQTISSLNIALKAMHENAAKDLASADAAAAKAKLLAPTHPEQDDPNIAAAMAAVSGQEPKPVGIANRLAALKAKLR